MPARGLLSAQSYDT